MRKNSILVVLSIWLGLMGCQWFGGEGNAEPRVVARAAMCEGVDQFYQLSDRLYSGAQPMGEASFKRLAELGVKRIVTVDSVKPSEQLAGKYGLEIVHIPVGYDGIDLGAQSRMVRAYREAGGKVFVHCHHGTQRGPVAGAIMLLGLGEYDQADAMAWLKIAGTNSKKYRGLIDVVTEFDRNKINPDIEMGQVELDRTAVMMGEADRLFQSVRAHIKADLMGEAENQRELLLLSELFIEQYRADQHNEGRDKAYRKRMKQMGDQFGDLYASLQKQGSGEKVKQGLKASMGEIYQSCVRCHELYRD